MTHFRCPYCDRDQAVVIQKMHSQFIPFELTDNEEGKIGARIVARGCSNNGCLKTSVDIIIGEQIRTPTGYYTINISKEPLFSQRLLPQVTARPYPDFIPKALLDDYKEACLIKDLSPKASATLIRRCIQGMIRDFCGINKGTLAKEIESLRAAFEAGHAPKGVTEETVEAIDQVRAIGNIGAHMEKDINHIIPVEPNEARALISLVEMLFDEWYVARHVREKKLASIKAIADGKEQAKKPMAITEAIPMPPEQT